MDMQAAPPTYAEMNTGQPPVGSPPVLGQQIPGMSGGLPAQGGLSVLANPMAQQLQSMGRDEDTMLVHMTPNEVNSLQGLAMAHGGSLTINPETGLPEAGFLKKLLPTLLGIGLNFIPGVGPLAAAGLVAAGSVAKTGSLSKGLMAGLQAYGGASLAGGLAPAATGSKIAATAAPKLGIEAVMKSADMSSLGNVAQGAGQTVAKKGLAGFAQNFGNAAKAGLPAGTPGFISKAAPMLAASGVLQGVSGAMAPSMGTMGSDGVIDNSYAGPYTAQKRTPSFAKDTSEILGSSKERRYFDVDMPEVYNVQGQVVQPGSSTARGTPILQNVLNPNAKKGQNRYSQIFTPYMGEDEEGYADGGEIELADGAFVLDARTVSEMGNGSSNAGMEALRRIGGRPIKGPGDGVSDSIPARIGRDQPARVARDEVVVPAEAVRRIGKGSQKRGADKLYALMDKAHKARKKAKRGQDTKLRRGLA
jgi:hypothetical protein